MRAPGFSVFASAIILAAPSAAAQGRFNDQVATLDCTVPDLQGKNHFFVLTFDEREGAVKEISNGYTTKFRATFAPQSIVYQRFSTTAEINRVNGVITIFFDKGARKTSEGTCSVAPPAAQPLLSRLSPLSDVAAANARRS